MSLFTSLSEEMISAISFMYLIIAFARLYPGADFAPNINVTGEIFLIEPSFIPKYMYSIEKALRSCLLYS